MGVCLRPVQRVLLMFSAKKKKESVLQILIMVLLCVYFFEPLLRKPNPSHFQLLLYTRLLPRELKTNELYHNIRWLQ